MLLVLILLVCTPSAQAQRSDDDFDCDSHTLFVNRLSAIPSEAVLPDGPNTRVLATEEFSGFAKYGMDSVRITIHFDPWPDSITSSAPALPDTATNAPQPEWTRMRIAAGFILRVYTV